MKQQISILGCGWLGKPLAINLIQQGHKIKGSTTSEFKLSGFREIGVVPFIINLDDLKENISAFLDSELLIVALPSKNIDGFKNLLSHIEKSPIKKVVFISSTSVYANSNEMVTEESDTLPSALTTIEMLFKNSVGFDTTIIRFAGLFGYARKPGNFFSKGRKIPNPEGFVNMIHQDDCIRLIEKIIAKKAWKQIFNGCADTHPTRREFYSKTTLDIGLELPVFEDVVENNKKIISNKKSKELLNFEYKYGNLLQLNYENI
ncbi:NAD-dependent epimerase/dehydratase family protein [Lutibacter sp.]|uniref:NAD-dependent epimerase/dehydratase family protein n=1 Tax=Lutibacter sp. TaxID=1925666 RepID=UPI0035692E41